MVIIIIIIIIAIFIINYKSALKSHLSFMTYVFFGEAGMGIIFSKYTPYYSALGSYIFF